MGNATQRFSDTMQTQLIDGSWVATIGWDVINFTSEYDAVNSCPIRQGSPHPLNSSLTCTSIGLTENKLTKAIVIANFGVTGLINAGAPPLARPEVTSWKWGKQTLPVDTDTNGNPIVNSAKDAFRSNFSRNFSVRYCRVERWEAYYDQTLAANYTDTINNAAIIFQGLYLGPGQCYFVSYAPIEPYQLGAPYVHVAYEFEIRTPNAPNMTLLQIRHPFQLRLVDQGLRGQYNDVNNSNAPTMGHFWLGGTGTQQCTRDVLLNGQGQPVDSTIKVTQSLVAANSQSVPSNVFVDSTSTATFLIYMIYQETNFALIGI